MKRYIKEWIIAAIQLFMFYIFPLFAGPTDAMGMVVLILLATLFLPFILGIISRNKIKFLYPVAAAVAFLPTVFIYYNSSALIHAVWYLVVASVGMLLGSLINLVFYKIICKE